MVTSKGTSPSTTQMARYAVSARRARSLRPVAGVNPEIQRVTTGPARSQASAPKHAPAVSFVMSLIEAVRIGTNICANSIPTLKAKAQATTTATPTRPIRRERPAARAPVPRNPIGRNNAKFDSRSVFDSMANGTRSRARNSRTASAKASGLTCNGTRLP